MLMISCIDIIVFVENCLLFYPRYQSGMGLRHSSSVSSCLLLFLRYIDLEIAKISEWGIYHPFVSLGPPYMDILQMRSWVQKSDNALSVL